uniref:WAP domain-containing protein n=1 Tax=Sinocyclocheilus anshuiensis TaxID=1608454 RepID=A0A671PCD9_9TELE
MLGVLSHSAFSDLVSLLCVCITVKPGVCPKRFLGVGLCKGLCVNDIDCPKDEKCCSTKCGRKCTHPYKGIRYIGAWVPNTHRF